MEGYCLISSHIMENAPAVKPSDTAQRAIKIQRKKELERREKEAAERKYKETYNKYLNEQLFNWENSSWVKSKKQALEIFITNNSFEKEEYKSISTIFTFIFNNIKFKT